VPWRAISVPINGGGKPGGNLLSTVLAVVIAHVGDHSSSAARYGIALPPRMDVVDEQALPNIHSA